MNILKILLYLITFRIFNNFFIKVKNFLKNPICEDNCKSLIYTRNLENHNFLF